MTLSERDLDRLPTSHYIKKYYNNPDMSAWDMWMEDIDMVFSGQRKAFLSKCGDRMKRYDFNEMEYAYQMNELSLLDNDIRKFIAFLAGDGFFKKHNLSINEWVKMRNFINPLKNEDLELSIIEALSYEGGKNYIRKQLTNLYWWR